MNVLAVTLVSILLVPIVFFLWSAIHEVSHWIAVKVTVPIKDTKFYLYPHKSSSGLFYWARVSWTYTGRRLTKKERAWVSFAPRWFDLLALVLFPLAYLFSSWGALFWVAVWGGGIIDLINGSIDRSLGHDMRKYSKAWNINPWIFRIVGVVLALTSLVTGLILLFT